MSWLRDPIVLFVVLGAALAVLHLVVRDDTPEIQRDTTIVVTDADVVWLAQVFEKTWSRPPTAEELVNLVDRRVRDEMLFREATALGLDAGDEALRRRIAMKLEFLAKDAGGAVEPTDAELQAHLDANAETYAIPPLRRFTHVYVNVDKRGENAKRDAKNLVETLNANPATDLDTVGDPMLLEREQPLQAPHQVARQFGQAFADAVLALDGDGWHGPIASSYGYHVVRIDERVEGGAAPLDLVRDKVRTDLMDQRRTQALETYVEGLREKYEVEMRTTLLEPSAE